MKRPVLLPKLCARWASHLLKALQEQAAKRTVAYVEYQGKVLDSYWVPLAGVDDIFLHFSIDISD